MMMATLRVSKMCLSKFFVRYITAKVIGRNFCGFKVRIDGEWYELSVHACEPVDTDKSLVDADMP